MKVVSLVAVRLGFRDFPVTSHNRAEKICLCGTEMLNETWFETNGKFATRVYLLDVERSLENDGENECLFYYVGNHREYNFILKLVYD